MSRKAIEEYVYTLCDDMDPSGANKKRYQEFFNSMDTKQFYSFMKKFIADDNQNFKITFVPMKNTPTMEFFENVAKKRKVPLYETMYMPYLTKTEDKDEAPASPEPVMILYLNVKRLVQTVMSKNSAGITITDRDMESGQVKNTDKHARLSDVQVTALLAQNQVATVAEYMNPRADDMKMMRDMLLTISEKGSVSLEDLDSDVMNKTAINTMNYYMLGGFLTTNLIDRNSYMLPYTIRNKEGQ